jgi:hypothetical protein
MSSSNRVCQLAILVIVVIGLALVAFSYKPHHESYADQVVHGQVGGIAGPLMTNPYAPYYIGYEAEPPVGSMGFYY